MANQCVSCSLVEPFWDPYRSVLTFVKYYNILLKCLLWNVSKRRLRQPHYNRCSDTSCFTLKALTHRETTFYVRPTIVPKVQLPWEDFHGSIKKNKRIPYDTFLGNFFGLMRIQSGSTNQSTKQQNSHVVNKKCFVHLDAKSSEYEKQCSVQQHKYFYF